VKCSEFGGSLESTCALAFPWSIFNRPTLIASFLAVCRRFFVGGAQELDDDTYARIPSEHTGRVLNKIGFQTVTAGDVRLSLNVSKVSAETGGFAKVFVSGSVAGALRSGPACPRISDTAAGPRLSKPNR
jgi:hypothetical protein